MFVGQKLRILKIRLKVATLEAAPEKTMHLEDGQGLKLKIGILSVWEI